MFQLDLKSKKSIYEQVVDGVKQMIVSGEYKADEKLPSVRDLSAQLTVNPNTIQKAFRTLEQQGWVYTVSGRGCFVSQSAHTEDSKEAEQLYNSIKSAVRELLFIGVDESVLIDRLTDMVEKGGISK